MHTYGSIFPVEKSHTMRGCAANVLQTAGILQRCTGLVPEGNRGLGSVYKLQLLCVCSYSNEEASLTGVG